MPELALEASPSAEPQEQGPISPPFSATKATTDSGNGTVVGASRSTGDQDRESNTTNIGSHPTLTHPERMWSTLI